MQRRIDVGNAEDPKAMCSADTPGPKPSDVYPNFSPGYNIIEGADRNDPVDEMAEKFLQMSMNLPVSPQQQHEMYAPQHSFRQQKSLKVDIRKSRLPSQTGDGGGLLVLSPKTPNMLPELLQYGMNPYGDGSQGQMKVMDSFGSVAPYMDPMAAADSFPGQFTSLPHEIHGVGLTPTGSGPLPDSLFVPQLQGQGLSTIIEHQRTESLSPGSQGDGAVVSPRYNSGPSLVQHQNLSPSAMSSAFPQGVMSLTPNAPAPTTTNKNINDNKQQTPGPPKPRGSRKKTLSLNPEEREALENLIEDVIIGGIANDESSNSSESEEDGDKSDKQGEDGSAGKDGSLNKEGLPKIYPAQLKVAVKHMRNLPPRFMRRLENAQKKIDAAEQIEAERVQEERVRYEIEAKEKEHERMRFREDQKREKKMKIRNLLEDLDQYTDEQSVSFSKDDSRQELKGKDGKRVERKAKPMPEIEGFRESSQPIHVGLSKGQISQGMSSQIGPDLTGELAQKFHGQHISMSHQGLPPVQALNCEDLERELLAGTDYAVPDSAPMYYEQQMNMSGNSAVPCDLNAMYNTHHMIDMDDRRTFLSAEAPEFVPYNFPVFDQPPPTSHIPQNFAPTGYPLHGISPQMPPTSSHLIHGQVQKSQASPRVHGSKYKPVPKDSPPSATVEMLRTMSSSSYNQSPVGRLSPHVVTSSMGRLSPQVLPVSGVGGPVVSNAPLPPTSQTINQMANLAGKLPTFMVPKVPTNVPPPGTAGVPPHPGVGMLPINPYQINHYSFPQTGFPPPPQQGFPYQQFVPPPGYIPWTEGNTDNNAPRGPISHHPLVGIPLKASPQMNRKRGGGHTPRQAAPTIRHGFVQHKPPPSDVKILGTDMAKKLVLQLISEGRKVMVLLRGCAGSGKSTLANEIQFDGVVLTTDDFFMNTQQGMYDYDAGKLGDAHVWNQNRAQKALEAGTNPVVIDNTNSQSWELKPYVSLALQNSYHIEIIEPDIPWKYNAKELAKRNRHGVTVETIRKMLDRFEHNLTLLGIMGGKLPQTKESVKENQQQQSQADGEETGKKTQRRRKKKKRKRNRHRSKKDKEGEGEDEKHSSDESSNDEQSIDKRTTALKPLEKRASLSSNETTTSPRETTPEMVEIMEPWENTFSDIKEDPQPEEVAIADCDKVVLCKFSGANAIDKDIVLKTSGHLVDGNEDATLKEMGNSTGAENDQPIVQENGFSEQEKVDSADDKTCSVNVTLVNNLVTKAGDALQSQDCAQTDSNNSHITSTCSAIVDRDTQVNDVTATPNDNVDVIDVKSARACTTARGNFIKTDLLVEPNTVEFSHKTSKTGDMHTDEIDNNVIDVKDNNSKVELTIECEAGDDIFDEELSIKEEVTTLIQEHIMEALVRHELAQVIDVSQDDVDLIQQEDIDRNQVEDPPCHDSPPNPANPDSCTSALSNHSPHEYSTVDSSDHGEPAGVSNHRAFHGLPEDVSDHGSPEPADLSISDETKESEECGGDLVNEGLDMKEEVTKLLQEHIMEALVRQELGQIIDVHQNDLAFPQTDDRNNDFVSDLEDAEDIHIATIADLQKALQDIEYDNPDIEADSDIDLDHEYGFEATGTKVDLVISNSDIDYLAVDDLTECSEEEEGNPPNMEHTDNMIVKPVKEREWRKEETCDCVAIKNDEKKDEIKELSKNLNGINIDKTKDHTVTEDMNITNCLSLESDQAAQPDSDNITSASSQMLVVCDIDVRNKPVRSEYWTSIDLDGYPIPSTVEQGQLGPKESHRVPDDGVAQSQAHTDVESRPADNGLDLITEIESPGPKPRRERRESWNKTSKESDEDWDSSLSTDPYGVDDLTSSDPSSPTKSIQNVLAQTSPDVQDGVAMGISPGDDSNSTPPALVVSYDSEQVLHEVPDSVRDSGILHQVKSVRSAQARVTEYSTSCGGTVLGINGVNALDTLPGKPKLDARCLESTTDLGHASKENVSSLQRDNEYPINDNDVKVYFDPSHAMFLLENETRDSATVNVLPNLISEVGQLSLHEPVETSAASHKGEIDTVEKSDDRPIPSHNSLVQPDVRQKLLGQNWRIPAQSVPQSPNKATATPMRSLKTTSTSSQVHNQDLVFVHKLHQSNLEAVLVMDDYNIQGILPAVARPILQGCHEMREIQSSSVRSGHALSLHKGCQTDDDQQLQALQELQEKVTMLQGCFSDASREDILHILEKCKGDMEWASNILLDGIPQVNATIKDLIEPAELVQDDVELECVINQLSKQTLQQQPPGDEDSLSSLDKLATTEIDILITDVKLSADNTDVLAGAGCESSTSPDSLVIICHKTLSEQGVISPDDIVLEQVAENSTDRVRSIDEYQHQHFQTNDSPRTLHNGQSDNLYTTPDSVSSLQGSQSNYQQLDRDQNYVDTSKMLSTGGSGNMALDEFHLPPPVSRRITEMKSVIPPPSKPAVNGLGTPIGSDSVLLKLTPQLAQQLIQMFGPVQAPFAPVTLSEEELEVSLDRETARRIHEVWGQTLTQRLGSTEMDETQRNSLEDDEALARRLQNEEYDEAKKSSYSSNASQSNAFKVAGRRNKNKKSKNGQHSSSSTPGRNSPAQDIPSTDISVSQGPVYQQSKIRSGEIAVTVHRASPVRQASSPSKPAGVQRTGDIIMTPTRAAQVGPSLREIMDEEQALEASRLEYLDSQEEVQANEGTLSTRLKWQQLVEKFPGVDPQMLTEVFQSTGYHMESTVHAIESSLGQQGPAQTVMTKEAAQRMEEQIFQQAVDESLRMWPDTEESPTKETLYQTLEEPMYSDFRAEASTHYKQRQECFDKAAAAYKSGMKDVASFYSQQGHVHTEKLKQANLRAAETIVSFKNGHLDRTNSIDLHGLHVDEALHVLETVLAEREIEQRERPDKRKSHLSIVTGRGTHSRGGIAKIRPAVLDFLKRHNYRWSELTPSILKVQLKYRDI